MCAVADPGIFNGGGAAEDEAPKAPRGGGAEGVPPPQKNFEFGALKCHILVQSGAYYKLERHAVAWSKTCFENIYSP